jgi:peptidoglycan hydrolase-like protein with peptidoglycan-binding domain
MCAAIAATVLLMTASGAAATQRGTVNTDSLVIRQSADTESKALQTLREGETLEILSSSGDWYKVSYGRFTGYVMKTYVKAVESASDANKKAIARLGDAPAPIRKGDSGSDVKKLQRALTIAGAYDGSIDGDYGDLTEEAVKSFQKDKRLTADGVAGEDTIRALFGQEAAKPPEEEKGMSGIESLNDIGDTPATSEKGDSGSKVKKLQQALKLKGYYDGPVDGDFGESTEAAVKSFQKAKGMSQDGVAGKTTIFILFGEKAANAGEDTYKTEKLNWFDGGSTAIPKGAVFTVKDVYTGKTFECKRWSGYNHLDAEPLTADDTATMKSVYGGSWSWTRRPILVKYNGHVYACSMNGMPHEDDTIASNNFAGHFCIHFYKSKTHGTDRVDEDHQACVEIAARAKW